MKKILAMLGVMLFSVSVFALNTEAPADEICPGKAAFEQKVSEGDNDFIAKYILVNLADPFARLTDTQALAQAQCYAQYHVKGETLVNFVRLHAGQFLKQDRQKLLTFAARVEGLDSKAGLEKLGPQEDDTSIIEYIYSNMLVPFEKLSDTDAAVVAKIYAATQVKGEPFVEYVETQAKYFTMDVEIKFESFAWRIEKLSK